MIDQNLTPEQIAHIYMLYHHEVPTIHVKHPDTHHAKNSLLKSWLGCSNYQRENFKWDNYRILLIRINMITDGEMFELAKVVAGDLDKEYCFEQYNIKRNGGNITYNISGFIYVGLNLLTCEVSCWDNAGGFPAQRFDLGNQYLISQGYNMPIFFHPDHPCNGKTPIELGVALDFHTYRRSGLTVQG